MSVASVKLCLRSWYGHPEEDRVGRAYQAARRGSDNMVPLEWESGLRCWNLLDAEGLMVARAFEPTAQTPRWVFASDKGHGVIDPPLSMEQLTQLMVEYRLMGGIYA